MTKYHSAISLVVSLLVVALVSAAGAWLTMESVATWYPSLQKPPLNPPDWVFGPVWTLLYAMMAVAAWRIYISGIPPKKKSEALTLYGLQLLLNLCWSFFFFYRQNISGGLIDILTLWILIVCTCVLFSRADRIAGWLLIPYILWVSFAVYLNAGIWWLNG